ncbi:MAG: hypothetical protein COA50_04130 [Flavobacteriaceae bacterium]|nr:MAG: hypothetical protein COA50_04130 [Flavobacteriaceae bacterium]
MENYTLPHLLNISIHVLSGSLALLLGIVALSSKKGKKWHRKSGKTFLFFMFFVILTGLFGVFIFKVNPFLLVISLLSGYQAFSGYRVLKSKSNTPKLLDVLVAIITLASGCYFIYYLNSIGMFWSPIIIYSTLGFLFVIITYDFLRYLIPPKKYKNIWIYEHIYKMIAAFTALLSAFIGTILPQYHPYSQILPSAFGTLLAIGFILYQYRSSNKKFPKTRPTLP